MEFQRLEATQRKGTGKGKAHQLRGSGRVPGVVYGGQSKPMPIDLEPRALRQALLGPYRLNTVLNLAVHTEDGKTAEMLVMLQDHQIHPRTRKLLHVDLFKVDLEAEVQVDVPLVTTGKCRGVGLGGVLLQVFHKVPIRCRPADIPVQIEHDITEIGIGQSLKASELTAPPGVKVLLEPEQAVVAVAAPTIEEKAVVEAAPAEGEEAAEGEKAEGEKAEGEKPERELTEGEKADARKAEARKAREDRGGRKDRKRD